MPKGKYKRHKFTKKELVKRRAKRHADREASTQYDNPAQVVTIDQWARLCNFSYSTARRILFNSDDESPRPPLLRISTRRYGIRLADHIKQERLAGAS